VNSGSLLRDRNGKGDKIKRAGRKKMVKWWGVGSDNNGILSF
jgi:hypothetical protein